MRNLNQFVRFDWGAFAAGKKFLYLGQSKWVDHNTQQLLGTRVEVVIASDKTEYKPAADGTPAQGNRFEKLTVKVPGAVNIPEESYVEIVNPVATVYGDFRNQLSVKADAVKQIPQVAKPAKD